MKSLVVYPVQTVTSQGLTRSNVNMSMKVNWNWSIHWQLHDVYSPVIIFTNKICVCTFAHDCSLLNITVYVLYVCIYICECVKNTVHLKKSWGLFVQYYFHVHLLYGCWQTTKRHYLFILNTSLNKLLLVGALWSCQQVTHFHPNQLWYFSCVRESPRYLVYQHIYRAYNGWSLYLQWPSISSYVINSYTADNTMILSNL